MKKSVVLVALAGVLFTSACGGGSTESQNKAEDTAVASASAVASSSSATPTASASATTSASASSSASASASETASAEATESATASSATVDQDAFGGVTPAGDIPVKLRARTNGTAEISIYQRDASGFYEEEIAAGDWSKEWLVANNKTFSFQVDASSNRSDATEVWCELEYNGKIIAAQHITAESSDVTKAVCGFTGDLDTMAVQEPVL